MLRRLLFIFLLISIACGEKVIEKPEHLIPREKMADILYDLSLINAAKSTNPKILEQHNVDPTELLFQEYGVDSLQFVKSDLYYASIPLEYEAIYEKITARLAADKKEIEETRKRKNDSVRKLSEKQDAKISKGVRKTVRDTLP